MEIEYAEANQNTTILFDLLQPDEVIQTVSTLYL